jgi:uncharacterized protein YbaP (TraB family)
LTGVPLWVVERDGARVYICGVRPIAGDGAWLTPVIENALGECEVFWCETPPATEFTSHPLLAELGLSDVPLRDRLDASTNERLDGVARAAGLDPAGLQVFRPWVAGQIVRHATYAPLYSGPTMDETLADMALRHGATVRTEFTADAVIRTFGEMSAEVEADMLRFELDSLEPGAAMLRERYLRGINGNLAWDEAEALHVATKYPELFDVILRHRNLAWEPRIDAALRDRVPTFVAVGTLHLVGPDNVLSLLRDEVLPA